MRHRICTDSFIWMQKQCEKPATERGFRRSCASDVINMNHTITVMNMEKELELTQRSRLRHADGWE